MHLIDELTDRLALFADRADAGRQLARLLEPLRGTDALILAVPSGGVPVAAEVARVLELPLDVAVVSKVTLPWNSEVGCGAVAFDGAVRLDEEYAHRVGLTGQALTAAVERTRDKVKRRLSLFRADRPAPRLTGRTVVLVDDGVASGSTLMMAVEAVRRAGASRVLVAVPTGHVRALEALGRVADDVYCVNARSGWRFAVAEAYQTWFDEDEARVAALVAPRPTLH